MDDKIVKIKFVVTVNDAGWHSDFKREGEGQMEIDMPVSAIQYMDVGNLLSSLVPVALKNHLENSSEDGEKDVN